MSFQNLSTWVIVITVATLVVNDVQALSTCTQAVPIEGQGVFEFDSRSATDDSLSSCHMKKDVWYRWTATCSGMVTIDTCGATYLRTRIAVYEDQACRKDMEALVCEIPDPLPIGNSNYKYCGAQSHVQLMVEEGKPYLIRLGIIANADVESPVGGVGHFTIQCGALEHPVCQHGDEFCREPDLHGLLPYTGNTTKIATQFTPEYDGIIHTVCLWGAYTDPRGRDCSLDVEDRFQITYYRDIDGLPGEVVAGPFSLSLGTMTMLSRARMGRIMFGGLHEYEFRLDHEFVFLEGDTCYWMEVVNNQSSTCRWQWETTNQVNVLPEALPRRSYQRTPRTLMTFGSPGSNNYLSDDFLTEHPAFCLDTVLSSESGCGLPVAGDVSEAAVKVESGGRFVDVSGAQSESVQPVCDLPLGADGFYRDIWFEHTTDCDGVLVVDVFDAAFDPRLAIYDATAAERERSDPLQCNDDDVAGLSDARATVAVESGETFLIRLGDRQRNIDLPDDESGFERINGRASMDIACLPKSLSNDCVEAVPMHLPFTFEGSNVATTTDHPDVPGTHAWIAFTLPSASSVRLDYGDSPDRFERVFDQLATSCEGQWYGQRGTIEAISTGRPRITWSCLPAGTYYYPVIAHRQSEGAFLISARSETCGGVCSFSTAGCLDAHDDAGCEDQTCCEQVCLFDPACCTRAWDERCAEKAALLCDDSLFDACSEDHPHECCETHDSGGCRNEYICRRTCACDPYCCLVAWDQLCIAELGSLNPSCGGLRDLNVDGTYDLDSYCLGGTEPDVCEISCMGDHNCDGYSEWWDYGWWWDHCRIFNSDLCVAGCLASFDFDYSGDIDLSDFASFQNVFTGF